MLGHRRRRWPNITITLIQRLAIAGFANLHNLPSDDIDQVEYDRPNVTSIHGPHYLHPFEYFWAN